MNKLFEPRTQQWCDILIGFQVGLAFTIFCSNLSFFVWHFVAAFVFLVWSIFMQFQHLTEKRRKICLFFITVSLVFTSIDFFLSTSKDTRSITYFALSLILFGLEIIANQAEQKINKH